MIIIDTNSLIYAIENKVDVFTLIKEEFSEIIVPAAVIKELELLQEKAKKGSERRAAGLAIQIIKHAKIRIINIGKGHTDKQIVNYAKKAGAAVLTNDSGLKRELKKAGITVFTLRQKKLVSEA